MLATDVLNRRLESAKAKPRPYLINQVSRDSIDLTDQFLIGSDSSASLRILEAGIEGRHCRLLLVEDRWLIKDLRSHTGTWLNGTQVLEAFMSNGDILKIGDVELQFVYTDRLESRQDYNLASKNAKWSETLKKLAPIARSHFAVLVTGPSGVGKELVARSLHASSMRASGPFYAVNCSAITETLLESELFGHIKGSFTGATSDRKGAFEAAREGTLFLDEIGDLSVVLQAKLLRALENNEIRPVGSDRIIRTNVRVVAATHQDLNKKLRTKTFRADLYYRLNVIRLSVPALAERMEDFEDLLMHFSRQMRVRFSIDAIDELKKHNWPGNIRELRNLVSRASALYPAQTIDRGLVPTLIEHLEGVNEGLHQMPSDTSAGRNILRDMEKKLILAKLSEFQGNQKRTAQALGVPKSTLNDKLRSWGVDSRVFKKKNGQELKINEGEILLPEPYSD